MLFRSGSQPRFPHVSSGIPLAQSLFSSDGASHRATTFRPTPTPTRPHIPVHTRAPAACHIPCLASLADNLCPKKDGSAHCEAARANAHAHAREGYGYRYLYSRSRLKGEKRKTDVGAVYPRYQYRPGGSCVGDDIACGFSNKIFQRDEKKKSREKQSGLNVDF